MYSTYDQSAIDVLPVPGYSTKPDILVVKLCSKSELKICFTVPAVMCGRTPFTLIGKHFDHVISHAIVMP